MKTKTKSDKRETATISFQDATAKSRSEKAPTGKSTAPKARTSKSIAGTIATAKALAAKLDASKSLAEKAETALSFATQLQAEHANWVEANNKLYGLGGILTQLFPTAADRAAFLKTKESAAIRDILESLPEPKSQVGKPRSELNGKILARVPKSIHAALLAEAETEGVSLNQLIVSKLSVQLRAAI